MSYDRNMQMNYIIYERLCLPPSAPTTYKEFSPPPHVFLPNQTGTLCTTETIPLLIVHAHKRGCWRGYCGWVGKVIWQTNEEKGGREGAETWILGKCLGGHNTSLHKGSVADANFSKQQRN